MIDDQELFRIDLPVAGGDALQDNLDVEVVTLPAVPAAGHPDLQLSNL